MCGRRCPKGDPEEPDDHALGRSRGGFTTKLHLLTDGEGHPLGFHLTAGQVHESTVVDAVMMTVNDMADCDGQPVAWPVAVGGDKGYRAEWIDEYLLELGINPVIPSKGNEDRNARAVEFDRDLYRKRNIVERAIGWLKEFRRIFARFEKSARNFGGMIRLGFIQRYMRKIHTDCL
jgi:transposase